MDDPPQPAAAGGSSQVPSLKDGPKGPQFAPATVEENSVVENPKLPSGAQDYADAILTCDRVGSLEQHTPNVAAADVAGSRAGHTPRQEHRQPHQFAALRNESAAGTHKEGEICPPSSGNDSGIEVSLFAASSSVDSRAKFMESCRLEPPMGKLEYSPAPGEDLSWDAELQRQFGILTDTQLEDAAARLTPPPSSAPLSNAESAPEAKVLASHLSSSKHKHCLTHALLPPSSSPSSPVGQSGGISSVSTKAMVNPWTHVEKGGH